MLSSVPAGFRVTVFARPAGASAALFRAPALLPPFSASRLPLDDPRTVVAAPCLRMVFTSRVRVKRVGVASLVLSQMVCMCMPRLTNIAQRRTQRKRGSWYNARIPFTRFHSFLIIHRSLPVDPGDNVADSRAARTFYEARKGIALE